MQEYLLEMFMSLPSSMTVSFDKSVPIISGPPGVPSSTDQLLKERKLREEQQQQQLIYSRQKQEQEQKELEIAQKRHQEQLEQQEREKLNKRAAELATKLYEELISGYTSKIASESVDEYLLEQKKVNNMVKEITVNIYGQMLQHLIRNTLNSTVRLVRIEQENKIGRITQRLFGNMVEMSLGRIVAQELYHHYRLVDAVNVLKEKWKDILRRRKIQKETEERFLRMAANLGLEKSLTERALTAKTIDVYSKKLINEGTIGNAEWAKNLVSYLMEKNLSNCINLFFGRLQQYVRLRNNKPGVWNFLVFRGNWRPFTKWIVSVMTRGMMEKDYNLPFTISWHWKPSPVIPRETCFDVRIFEDRIVENITSQMVFIVDPFFGDDSEERYFLLLIHCTELR